MMQVPIQTISTLVVAVLLLAVAVQSQIAVNQTMTVEAGQNNTNATTMSSTSTETTTTEASTTTTVTVSPETSSAMPMGRANDPPSTNQTTTTITTTSASTTTSSSSSSSIQNVTESSTTDDLLSLLNISDGWMPGNFPPPKSTTRDEAIMTTFVSSTSHEAMVENTTTHVHGIDPMTSSDAPSFDIHAEDHNSSNLDKAKYDVHHGMNHDHSDHNHDHSHQDHDHGDDSSNTDPNETKSTTVGYSKEVAMDGRPRTSNARAKQGDNACAALGSAPLMMLVSILLVSISL